MVAASHQTQPVKTSGHQVVRLPFRSRQTHAESCCRQAIERVGLRSRQPERAQPPTKRPRGSGAYAAAHGPHQTAPGTCWAGGTTSSPALLKGKAVAEMGRRQGCKKKIRSSISAGDRPTRPLVAIEGSSGAWGRLQGAAGDPDWGGRPHTQNSRVCGASTHLEAIYTPGLICWAVLGPRMGLCPFAWRWRFRMLGRSDRRWPGVDAIRISLSSGGGARAGKPPSVRTTAWVALVMSKPRLSRAGPAGPVAGRPITDRTRRSATSMPRPKRGQRWAHRGVVETNPATSFACMTAMERRMACSQPLQGGQPDPWPGAGPCWLEGWRAVSRSLPQRAWSSSIVPALERASTGNRSDQLRRADGARRRRLVCPAPVTGRASRHRTLACCGEAAIGTGGSLSVHLAALAHRLQPGA